MSIEIIGKIEKIETIAKGKGVHIRKLLNKKFGRHVWSKKKGIAKIRKPNGDVVWAEVHWFEAHGVGKVNTKVKFEIGE